MIFSLSYLLTQCQEVFYRLKTDKHSNTGYLKNQRFLEGDFKILTIQELFITNLKAYRKLHNISQTQLANLCDSSTGYIGEIESGKRFPSVNMIERIAKALDIESWYLFKNEPIKVLDSNSQKKLAPTQKNEIIKIACSALTKILDNY